MSARFPLIPPSELSGEKKEVRDAHKVNLTLRKIHDYLVKAFGAMFGDRFTWHDDRGAINGPFRLLLETPVGVAKGFYQLCAALGADKSLPQSAREVAILAAGAHYKAVYELYAHAHVAQTVEGLSKDQIERVVKGKRPGDGGQLDLAFDVSQALIKRSGPLEDKLFKRAVDTFGTEGALVLFNYTGFYAYTSILLNAGSAEVPEGETIV